MRITEELLSQLSLNPRIANSSPEVIVFKEFDEEYQSKVRVAPVVEKEIKYGNFSILHRAIVRSFYWGKLDEAHYPTTQSAVNCGGLEIIVTLNFQKGFNPENRSTLDIPFAELCEEYNLAGISCEYHNAKWYGIDERE